MNNENDNIAVEVKNLLVRFGSFTAVNNISFSVNKGEIFGFLGANGAGKTTTIRCLCGLLIPTGGDAVVGGASVSKDPMKVKSVVGYMSQKFTLYDDLTIEENLKFAAALRKLDNEYFNKRVDELYKMIDLTCSKKTMVRDLPGGTLQQVALIASTLHDPSIIFLDEPTAGVTPSHRALFWDLIKKIAAEGKTVFVTTHYMDEAEQCGRIALMRAGEIIALGTPNGLKKETFPEPIYEVTPPESVSPEWLEKLKSENFIDNVCVYGMRYHVRVKDDQTWKNYFSRNLNGFSSRRIEPTLEDVFLRKVEGANR